MTHAVIRVRGDINVRGDISDTMKMLRLEGASRDISDVLNRARAEAIKLHVPTVVEYDFPNGRFWAFTDHDHDLSYKCPGMIACPGPYRTDEYIWQWLGRVYTLPVQCGKEENSNRCEAAVAGEKSAAEDTIRLCQREEGNW